RIAEALVERETITGDDLNLLIEGRPLPADEGSRQARAASSGQGGTPGKADPSPAGGSDFSFEVQGEGQAQDAGTPQAGQDAPKASQDPQNPQG
ncbi:MAG: hypothetical protein II595_05595, partial [Desulfovibrio sp.]|nr:hypothetical protein [Desulfovibrio sp.]